MSQAEVNEIADKAVLDVPVQPVDDLDITGTVKGERPGDRRSSTTARTIWPRCATG